MVAVGGRNGGDIIEIGCINNAHGKGYGNEMVEVMVMLVWLGCCEGTLMVCCLLFCMVIAVRDFLGIIKKETLFIISFAVSTSLSSSFIT